MRAAAPRELSQALAATRSRWLLTGVLLALAAIAWWSTVNRMAGMDMGPGTDLGSLGWFLGVWVVMMAAMMLPSLAPTTAVYAQLTRGQGFGQALLFSAGYILTWALAGVAAYGVFRLGRSTLSGALAWNAGGRWTAGGLLALAAAYELTPAKRACLSRCRSPRGFLLGNWRDGWLGAIEMGSRHGAVCLGCCAALMTALFALGAMSLTWMALIAGLIALEKTLPWGRAATYVTAGLLLLLALAVALAPHQVPGLVVPGGHSAMSHSAMD